MPKGMRGFQPGRKKTGGRVKGGSLKKSKRFIDQLQRFGLNVAKELAHGVMAIEDPVVRFNEVRRLLPYLVPELKPVDPIEDPLNNPEEAVSTEDLLEALHHNGRKDEPVTTKPDPIPVVETGSADAQTPTSTDINLSNVVGEQEDN